MTVALSSPAASDLARLVRRGIAWWLGELAQMLPHRLSNLLGRDADPVVLMTIGPGGGAIWPSDAYRPSAGAVGRRQNAVTIGIDPSLVLETSIDLPQAAERSLRQILEHQIERLVPLAAGETRFDFRVAPGADENLIRVRVFIVKRAAIDEALVAARAAGLNPRRVILAGWRETGRPPSLWEADNRADASRALRRRLEIAAIVFAAIAYGFYLHRLDQVRDELQERVAVAQQSAKVVGMLARNLAIAEADAAFFARRAQEAPPLPLIDALTKLVPKNTWLTGLVINRRNIEISGYSPNASSLVALVERSALFENPRFSSSITLAADGKREHFDLSFEAKMAPEP